MSSILVKPNHFPQVKCKCPCCNGDGTVDVPTSQSYTYLIREVECESCDGSGEVNAEPEFIIATPDGFLGYSYDNPEEECRLGFVSYAQAERYQSWDEASDDMKELGLPAESVNFIVTGIASA